MSEPNQQSEAVKLVLVFYGAMAAAGTLLAYWRSPAWENIDPWALPGAEWPLHLGVTLALVAAVHWATRLAMARFRSVRQSGRDLRRMLGDLSPATILLFAIASGVGEELLFRGWLLGETGLVISSLLFGAIHIPPNRKWLYWPAFAAAMGFLLGWLYLWSGSLVYPILLHAGINYFNMRHMYAVDAPPGAR